MIDAKWYEQNILGHSTEKPYITEYTIEYLKDNGFSEQEIIEVISSVKGEYVFYKDIPDNLYGTLVEKDKYYFHPELQILSKPPVFNINNLTAASPKFFKEMRIRYTEEDLINYFHSKANPKIIRTPGRDFKAIEYLCKRYSTQLMEPVDCILHLIDDVGYKARDFLDIQNYELITLERIDQIYLDSVRSNTNKIIYRWETNE